MQEWKEFVTQTTMATNWTLCKASLEKCIHFHHIEPTSLLIVILYGSYHFKSDFNIPAMKYLLTNYGDRVNPNATSVSNPQNTAAHIAARYDDAELIQLLFDHFGDLNLQNTFHMRPLYTAMLHRKLNAMVKLLWLGVEVDDEFILDPLVEVNLKKIIVSFFCVVLFLHFIYEESREDFSIFE